MDFSGDLRRWEGFAHSGCVKNDTVIKNLIYYNSQIGDIEKYCGKIKLSDGLIPRAIPFLIRKRISYETHFLISHLTGVHLMFGGIMKEIIWT